LDEACSDKAEDAHDGGICSTHGEMVAQGCAWCPAFVMVPVGDTTEGLDRDTRLLCS
jgi:hypothetical protein